MSTQSAPLAANPYPGLRPFTEDDQHLFFGRESQVDSMVRKLAAHRFLAVVGTSGSGKSSLVNCGLKPALRRGLMAAAGTSWRVVQFRPGGEPIRAMARALAAPDLLFDASLDREGPSVEDVVDATLRMSVLGLVDVYEQSSAAPNSNLLLVVDQFEELFRYPAPQPGHSHDLADDEAIAFVNLLLQAVASERPIYIVLTMRSDFLGDCARFRGLPEAINRGEYLVPRLTRDECRNAIAGPIAVAGADISPVLLTRLLNDVGDNPDQLSILQHALNRTWAHWQRETRGTRPLELPDYENVGTMATALDRHAERAFAELDEKRQRICERLFQTLTDKSSDSRGIRRPTRLSALCAISGAGAEDVVAVIDVFRKPSRSFLMPSLPEVLEPDTVIDISHESLMRIWSRLKAWADEEAVSSAQYTRVAENARLHAQGSTGLLTDPELSLVLAWQKGWLPNAAWGARYGGNFEQAMRFLRESAEERDRAAAERERQRKKKLRNTQLIAASLGLLAIVALAAAYVARQEKLRAEENLALAKKAVDESLSSAGRRQARETQDVPELEEFRKELLDKAEVFYALLTQEKPRNDALLAESARAHLRLGDINRLLDRPQSAIQEYQEAISGFSELLKSRPDSRENLQGLGYAHNWMGETMRQWWERAPVGSPYSREDSEKQYEQAMHYQQQVHDRLPSDVVAQQELASTYYNRGIIRFDEAKRQGSEADFRAAVALLEPLATKVPTSKAREQTPEPAQDLARAYNDLANVVRESKPDAAVPTYQLAIDLTQKLREQFPQNREYMLELAQYYNNQASLLLKLNTSLELAEERNHQSVHLLEELSTPGPSLSMNLAKSLQLRAEILSAKGESREMREESDRILGLLKGLSSRKYSKTHPELHVLYMNLGINYLELAAADLNSGDIRGAKVSLDQLLQILPEVSDTDRETLTQAYRKLRYRLPAKFSQ